MRGLSLYHFIADMRDNIDQGGRCWATLFCCDYACRRRRFLDRLELKLEKCKPSRPTAEQLTDVLDHISSHRMQLALWGRVGGYEQGYVEELYHALSAEPMSVELNWSYSIGLLQIDRFQQVSVLPARACEAELLPWDERSLLFPDGLEDACDDRYHRLTDMGASK